MSALVQTTVYLRSKRLAPEWYESVAPSTATMIMLYAPSPVEIDACMFALLTCDLVTTTVPLSPQFLTPSTP